MNSRPNSNRSTPHDADNPAGDVGSLLRQWRTQRGRSQLDLSLQLGVSQRHLSFIESGRSLPSRAMLMALARVLDVPLRDRNNLFLAAGYAPAYSERPWDADEMHAVNRALQRMLKQHEPFPALVMDRWWNVLTTNDSAPRFFGSLIDLSAHSRPRNLLRLMFDPQGLRPFVHDWENVARSLFERIHRETVGGLIDGAKRELIAELLRYPDVERDWNAADHVGNAPVIPVGFIHDGQVRKYFSMVSTIGTPQTIAAQELRVESMFPADAETEAWHLATFG